MNTSNLLSNYLMPSPDELSVVVPHGTSHVPISTLFNTDCHHKCITVKVPSGCTLLLDALPDNITTTTHLFIEGPMPPPVFHADRHHVITATVVGPILPILLSLPNLVTLDFQAMSYDIDWAGLERASQIQHLKLWSYENVHRPLLLPPSCTLDLHGLVSWYRHDADRTLRYLIHAISKCDKPPIWSIGYYDPLHVRMFGSIMSQGT
jgi:hypothetical protein